MSTIPSVLGLHHFAWRCRDAEETRRFYEDLLGMRLVHVIKADHVPSTGEYCPYVHIFFEMADGSNIAFFDLGDGQSAQPSQNTPSWVNHIALKLKSLEELAAMKRRLEDAGVEVVGVTDHHFVRSIYFFDPNGFRMEFTVPVGTAEQHKEYEDTAHAKINEWTREKASRNNKN
ncbi:VOC family protein [Noviherbaspirillum malthae]|jgi:catechol 2,3-dioxygenase-like lactoylglutathione lyase family enzyme|uniref:VOC family protein n=1 Tax=Noviherbaspirillum malthae TaxID=1260987 RepID=UPI00188EF2C1|nr:VOC family protein [Noviherbaspirillum malthae]